MHNIADDDEIVVFVCMLVLWVVGFFWLSDFCSVSDVVSMSQIRSWR